MKRIKLKEFDLAIVDFDGTLVDSEKLYRFLLRKFLFSNHLLFKLYFGTFRKNIADLQVCSQGEFKNFVYSLAEFIETKKPIFFKGVKDFLTELKRRRIKIFLTTRSSTRRTKRILKDNKLFYFFELILPGEIPKREHLYIIKKYNRLSARQFSKRAFYLGDEPMDMYLAKQHHLFGVGITNTFNSPVLKKYGAKLTIANIKKLTKIIKEIPRPKNKPIKQ